MSPHIKTHKSRRNRSMHPTSQKVITILLLMLSTIPFSVAQLHRTDGATTPLTSPASGISLSATLSYDRGIASDTSITIPSLPGIDLPNDGRVFGASPVAVGSHSTSRELIGSGMTAPI